MTPPAMASSEPAAGTDPRFRIYESGRSGRRVDPQADSVAETPAFSTPREADGD